MVIIGLIITGIVTSIVLTPIIVVGIIDKKGSRSKGFKGSSEVIKNYKDWVHYKKDIAETERMLKVLIKFLRIKHLNPGPLEPLNTLLQLNWRRNKYFYSSLSGGLSLNLKSSKKAIPMTAISPVFLIPSGLAYP
jgi:hypothetical protein